MWTNAELDQARRHRSTLKAEIARAENELSNVNHLLVCESIKGFIADGNGFGEFEGMEDGPFEIKVASTYEIPDTRECDHPKNLLGTHVYLMGRPSEGRIGASCVFCGGL